jgi:hypothetical protein
VSDLFPLVREVLLHQWDPIGVAKIPAAHDEYDRYARRICERIKRGDDVRKLATYLLDLEMRSMGLAGNAARCDRVAASLTTLIKGD